MEEITTLGLAELMQLVKKKKISFYEINKAFLERIQRLNPKLNAFLLVNEDSHKIPAGIKDVIVTKGMRTTAGSKILQSFIPPYESTATARLLQNNISFIGKTNCDEFAMGSSGENSAYGFSRNPWDLEKVPGGSSSGSAVAVAADLCVFALGTDTGGSIRQPASLCGVVGLRPTYGLVSRYGLIAFASSLDTIGPITKTVEDAYIVLKWIAGPDGKDAGVHDDAVLKGDILKAGVEGLKIGVPLEYFQSGGLDKGVKKVVQVAVEKLEELGGRVLEVELPHTKYALATYYLIAPAEVSSNLARFDAVRFGGSRRLFGQEVKRRIMLGTFALSVGYFEDFYEKAARVRTLISRDFDKAFEKCDVIVGPVSPTVAWNIGEKIEDPLKMYMMDIYTLPSALAGLPALSVPCGFSKGLPVGLHIIGKRFDDITVLRVGYAYEQSIQWYLRKPNINYETL